MMQLPFLGKFAKERLDVEKRKVALLQQYFDFKNINSNWVTLIIMIFFLAFCSTRVSIFLLLIFVQ